MATRLSDPLTLPSGAVLSNRLAKAAMSEGFADADNNATSRFETLYRRWSHSGAGMLLTGNVQVDRDHLERPGNVVLDEASDRAALRAFPAGTIPPGTPEQRELVHAVFDRQKVHLLQRIAAEPLFAYGCRRWQPGRKDQNLELAQVLHERLAKLMGSLYDFDPAPLATGTAMPRRMHACYDETSGQLFLSDRHLNGTVGDFMEALAHQQAHCLQHGLIRRLAELPVGEPRQVIARAWAADFERWGTTCLPLSIGYFAHDLGGAVGKLVRGIDLEERSAGV